MKRFLAAAALAAAFLVPAIPAAHAGPLVTVQIQNSTAGGCLKDQGLGNPYSVSPCATASNFTRMDGHNIGGDGFYEYKDGTGFCVTADDTGQYFKAGNCAGANTQLLLDPDPQIFSLDDLDFNTGFCMTKQNVGSYIAGNITCTTGAPNEWQI